MLIYVLSSALAIVAIVYIVYHIVASFQEQMRVEPVQSAEISDQLTLTAVIFRDEQVIYGTKRGGVVRLFSDGERVYKNAVVARIYETLDKGDTELSKLESKIDVLNKSNVISDNSTKNLDAKINKLYYTIRLKTEEGDLASVNEKTKQLLVLLNQREILVNTRLNFNEELAALNLKRDALMQAGSGAYEEVETPAAGYFSSVVDGYEDIFTSDAAKTMSFDGLYELINGSSPELSVKNSGYSVGKIAGRPDWYICAVTDRTTASGLSEGRTYQISFPLSSSGTLDFELTRIVPENGGDRAIVVFKTDILSSDTGSARKQTVTLELEKITGLRVPVSAVRVDDDGNVGVFILKNNKVTFRRIEILSENDGYVIAKEFSPEDELYSQMLHKYDSLIVSGKDLKEQTDNDDGETTAYEIRIFG